MHNASGISSRRFDLSGSSHDDVSISHLIADRFVAEVNISEVETTPDVPLPRTFASGKRHSDMTAQEMSEGWFIGLSQARETIKVTTQNHTRSANCRRVADSEWIESSRSHCFAGTSTRILWTVVLSPYRAINMPKKLQTKTSLQLHIQWQGSQLRVIRYGNSFTSLEDQKN